METVDTPVGDGYTEGDPLNIEAEDNSNDRSSQNSYEEDDDDFYDDSDEFNPNEIEVVNEPKSLKEFEYEIPVGEIIYSIQKVFKYECMYCINVFDKFSLLSDHITDIHHPFSCIPVKVIRRQNAGEVKCAKILMSENCQFIHVCFLCQDSFDDLKNFSQHILENHLGSDGVLKVIYKEPNRERNVNHSNGFTSKQPKLETLAVADDDDEEKPYKCQFCNKGFKRDSDRKRHERIHTGERPYKCDICYKAFTQSGTLIGHKRTHFFQRFRLPKNV